MAKGCASFLLILQIPRMSLKNLNVGKEGTKTGCGGTATDSALTVAGGGPKAARQCALVLPVQQFCRQGSTCGNRRRETGHLFSCTLRCRLRLKYDGTRAETAFRLSAKRASPFKSAGASLQSTTAQPRCAHRR